MATCKDCALNGLGWCHHWDIPIPREKEAIEHDCDSYLPIKIDVDKLLLDKMEAHPEDKAILWTIQDGTGINPVTPPASWTAAAWRHIWTAQYFSMAERVALAKAWVPF